MWLGTDFEAMIGNLSSLTPVTPNMVVRGDLMSPKEPGQRETFTIRLDNRDYMSKYICTKIYTCTYLQIPANLTYDR